MIMKNVLLVLMITAVVLFTGCTETEKPPVFGNGELPAEYQSMFGNGNGARLAYMQNQAINKHSKIIAELAKRVIALEGGDPNDN